MKQAIFPNTFHLDSIFSGFELTENTDESFNLLRRWFGPDNVRLEIPLFEGIDLKTAITICDAASLAEWDELDVLVANSSEKKD
jgi:hypothetical protein